MNKFTKQIGDFKSYGGYNYQFDEVGNQVLNPSSSVFQQNYLSLPTVNLNYDESKILSFYNPQITEFVTVNITESNIGSSQELVDQINEMSQKNQFLQDRLNTMISESESTSTDADVAVIKDIVLELRIQLGQGKSQSDFSDEFPYFPIPIEDR